MYIVARDVCHHGREHDHRLRGQSSRGATTCRTLPRQGRHHPVSFPRSSVKRVQQVVQGQHGSVGSCDCQSPPVQIHRRNSAKAPYLSHQSALHDTNYIQLCQKAYSRSVTDASRMSFARCRTPETLSPLGGERNPTARSSIIRKLYLYGNRGETHPAASSTAQQALQQAHSHERRSRP